MQNYLYMYFVTYRLRQSLADNFVWSHCFIVVGVGKTFFHVLVIFGRSVCVPASVRAILIVKTTCGTKNIVYYDYCRIFTMEQTMSQFFVENVCDTR